MARRRIVVDGYNLILRSPALRPGEGRTLEQSREKLVNLLSWAVGTRDAEFLVVFDGAEERGPAMTSGRVQTRFSRPPEKADDLIRRLLEERGGAGGSVTVVTSDLAVARHARAMGADVALSDLFLASLGAGPQAAGAEKPAGLSKKEVEEWAELFKSRPTGEDEG